MYAGEHWQIARTLVEVVGASASLWVASAGYGLISADVPIHAYAATFAAGQPDSVAVDSAGARTWWHELSCWPGPQEGAPRSLAELAERDPDATIIAVLSDAYLRACVIDIRRAISRLADPENLSVFGPPGSVTGIEEHMVPVTAALRPLVGGSLQALNVRAARYVLGVAREAGSPLRRSLLAKLAADAAVAAPADSGRRGPGIRMSDAEVREFIRGHLGPGASATRLLRKLRDTGRSCEQARFRDLFITVVGEGFR
ncbi:hypothetical protein DI270_014525 [Microbispora triticiradicis]|uniref:Uncharacterized protein n=1 Tax=Microbispora triticiradicis TaxID=2200763 RepID=A0ABX9LL93_9ACTN|nr:hypothetical protein DI270_014525 [Microbispora triticiradicis]